MSLSVWNPEGQGKKRKKLGTVRSPIMVPIIIIFVSEFPKSLMDEIMKTDKLG